MPLKKIIFLVGPTASGKSAAAVCLARQLGAEIISCDSMQVYRGMDILTSKPSLALRRQIPHHLIGFLAPSEGYDVSEYRRDALAAIKTIFKNGKTPLFAGGTGLYLSVLVDGIFKLKPPKISLRKGLYRQAEIKGSLYLYNRLKKIDPEAAARIHPNDTRRLVRALEIFEATGKPISELQKQRRGLDKEYDIRIFCLDMPRDELYRRIDRRVEDMFKNGALKEAKKLLALKLSRTAGVAIGLKEIKGYLDGLYDLEEAKRLMQRNSRRYAKRQLTWFRKDRRIRWIKIKGSERACDVARRILKEIK
ncbi:MAG: tRNA (adenosine(37)-N6)-dimethylallyltransferase MiaA [Candidatus Omnitrophota bacterium]